MTVRWNQRLAELGAPMSIQPGTNWRIGCLLALSSPRPQKHTMSKYWTADYLISRLWVLT